MNRLLSLVQSMNDLLGDALPVVRKNDRPEAAALVEVLQALSAHPAVARGGGVNQLLLIALDLLSKGL